MDILEQLPNELFYKTLYFLEIKDIKNLFFLSSTIFLIFKV